MGEYHKQSVDIKYSQNRFSTFDHVYRGALKTLLLLAYLALMSANDPKYFQGAQSCNKKCQNQHQHWNDNPLVHPKLQCSNSCGDDPQANSSLKVIPQKLNLPMNYFETFPESSLLSTFSKKNKK